MTHIPSNPQTPPNTRVSGDRGVQGIWGRLRGCVESLCRAYEKYRTPPYRTAGVCRWIKEHGHEFRDVPPNPVLESMMDDILAFPDANPPHHRTVDQFGVSRIYDKDGRLLWVFWPRSATAFNLDTLPTEHITVEDEE